MLIDWNDEPPSATNDGEPVGGCARQKFRSNTCTGAPTRECFRPLLIPTNTKQTPTARTGRFWYCSDMAHGLDGSGGDNAEDFAFAYRKQGGAPWHKLGVAVDGHQPMGVMLREAKADYEVETLPLFVRDQRDGSLVEVDSQFATARVSPWTGRLEALGTVKGRYTVVQNADVLSQALDVVDAAHGDAVFDTLGVLDGGRQFFAVIDLGTLVIDPRGANDEIGRYLVVRSSHDGSTALTFSNTNIRAVCKNTVVLAERQAQRVYKAKHTPNIEDRIKQARYVLGLSTDWAMEFRRTAEEMLAIPLSPTKIDRVLGAVVPTGSVKRNKPRLEAVEQMRMLLDNERNVGAVGYNGWALWNAIVEWYDHYRPGTDLERAVTSMDDGSWVTRKKAAAQWAVLNLT